MLGSKINKNIVSIPYSLIREITEKAQQKKDCIILTIGEPDLDTPKDIIEYGCEYIRNNKLRYTQAGGSIKLRQLIAQHYNKYYNANINENCVNLHIGAIEAIASVLRTLLNVDDEVILPTPFFSPYEQAVKIAHGKPVYIDTEKDNFVLKPNSIEKVITNKTKAILFSNPNNPTGYMLKKEEIDELIEYFRKKDIFIIVDEIYSALSFYPFTSFASYNEIQDKTIIINGFSKSHSMTAWRIGYSIANIELRKYILNTSFNNVGSMVNASCAMAEYALENYPILEKNRNVYKERALTTYNEFKKYGFDVVEPRGAFYLFVRYNNFCNLSSKDFTIKLLEDKNVAVVAGEAFRCDGFFRMSLINDIDSLKEATNRIKDFLLK